MGGREGEGDRRGGEEKRVGREEGRERGRGKEERGGREGGREGQRDIADTRELVQQ